MKNSSDPSSLAHGPLTLANRVLEECDSTNLLAKSLAEANAPHGTWISAKRQSAGKGRLGRKWESIEGNLFLSVILRLEGRTQLSGLPLSAAVAVSKVVQSEFPTLPLRIKWPNDLWIGEKKVGGVLCEGAAGGGKSLKPYVVVGIGLNTASTPDSDLAPDATNLAQEIGSEKGFDPSDLANRIRIPIIHQLLKEVEELSKNGPASLIRFYDERALLPPGTEIEWGTPPLRGVVEGLGELGELKVVTLGGEKLSLYAEDVRKIRKASYGSRP